MTKHDQTYSAPRTAPPISGKGPAPVVNVNVSLPPGASKPGGPTK